MLSKGLFIIPLLAISTNLFAQTFEHETNKDGNNTITIIGYSGSKNDDIIIPKSIDGYNVTQIKKMISGSDYETEKIYIPNDITINLYITDELKTLRCGVIDQNVTILSNSSAFYYYSTPSSEIKLENIYSFGNQENTTRLIGSNRNTNLFYLGIIKVSYDDNTTESIVTYTFGTSNTQKLLFDETRFNNLLWAIDCHTQDKTYKKQNIISIDLRGLDQKISTESVNFSFGDFNPASLLNPGATVIVDENTRYTSSTLQDLTDYSAPAEDITNVIQYNRNDTKGWNSVCLPFDISEQDFPSEYDAKIYTISGAEENSILLSRVTEAIPAGTPCFVSTDAENWNLSLTERTISKDVKLNPQKVGDWQMVGSFSTQVIGKGKYKITADGQYISETQSADSKTFPFRCYLENNAPNGAPMRLDVNIENEEAITLIPDDAEPVTLTVYDLMGRPSTHQSLPHIQNGHKQIIR